MRDGIVAKIMRINQQICFSSSDLLALTNPRIATDTAKKYKCPTNIAVWSNGVDTQQFAPEKRSDSIRSSFGIDKDAILVGYVGLQGRFQGLDVILDAAIELNDYPEFQFIFIGDGVEKIKLQHRAQMSGANQIKFITPRAKSEIPSIVASCDISVVSLLARMPGTMPSKFYEACASGSIPLVADGCEAAPLVRNFGSGLVYEPGDANSVRAALLAYREMNHDAKRKMAEAARQLSLRFDRNALASHVRKCLLALRDGLKMPEQLW
jgi:glycosyltransferase involved in cell wall biosynthesis